MESPLTRIMGLFKAKVKKKMKKGHTGDTKTATLVGDIIKTIWLFYHISNETHASMSI
jgi:hypothetical protein